MPRRRAAMLALGATAASLLVAGVARAEPLLPLPPPLGPEPAAPTPREPVAAPGWPADIVTLTNDERAAAGCDALAVDDRLTAAAQKHTEDMAGRRELSHTGRDGSTFDERIRAEGHPRPGAENIAHGYPDAGTTVREWMASPGHRRNIVNCSYVTIGVGYDPHGNFATQDFGRSE